MLNNFFFIFVLLFQAYAWKHGSSMLDSQGLRSACIKSKSMIVSAATIFVHY